MRTLLSATAASLALFLSLSCTGSKGPEPIQDGSAVRITIDSVAVYNGQQATVSLRISPTGLGQAIDSIGSFDFLISYDDSLLSFLNAAPGANDSAWEYFTWRHYPTGHQSKLGTVRVLALRDLENGKSPPIDQRLPGGEFVRMTFNVTSNRDQIGQEPEITFWCGECTDNVLSNGFDDECLHIAASILSNTALSQMSDTLDCPRRYTLVPDIEFVSGAIKILAPPDDLPDAPITIMMDPVAGQAGDTIESDISIDYITFHPPQTLTFGGLEFSLQYDSSALSILSIRRGDQLADWEYFGWRRGIHTCASCPTYPGVQIVSQREMNDGTPSTGLTHPVGTIIIMKFLLNQTLTAEQACDAVSFWSNDIEHNGLSGQWSIFGDAWYMPLEERGGVELGPDYDTQRCSELGINCIPFVGFRKIGCGAQP